MPENEYISNLYSSSVMSPEKFIAALFVMGAVTFGCNGLKDEPEIPAPEKTVTLTSTVGFEGGSTKALTAAGVKTFAAGDRIAVFYKNTNNQTVKAVSEELQDNGDITNSGKNATFTVTLTGPAPGGTLRYVYPASMAMETVAPSSDLFDDHYSIDIGNLRSQDGTLATIASDYDLAVYDGTLTDGAALPASVTLSNRLAILELTVKNASGTPVNGSLTKLSVYDGTNYYRISRTQADEPIYVALCPVNGDQTIDFCAIDDTKIYRKSVTGKTLDRNNIYPVRLTTAENTGTALEFVTGTNYTVQDGETLSGTLLGTTRIKTKSTATDKVITVTLNGIDIVSNNNAPGIECQGNTNLVLAEGSVNHVMSNEKDYAGINIASLRTLTICGSGTLYATGCGKAASTSHHFNYGSAGIGGNSHSSCGNIVIISGTITATGGECAAGIGSGCNDLSGTVSCGTITISGGNITATGGKYGAGIGSALANKPVGSGSSGIHNTCGAILITGGTVTATGGKYAAGIGCGYADGTGTTIYVRCRDITITTGVTSVTAIRGNSAPHSIGTGKASGDGKQSCGTITIGCTLDDEGDPVGGTVGEVATSPYIYQP